MTPGTTGWYGRLARPTNTPLGWYGRLARPGIFATPLLACLLIAAPAHADDDLGAFTQAAPGAPRAWQGGYGISPYSTYNLYNGNVLTQVPIVSYDPVGPPVSFALFHNLSDANGNRSGATGQGFDLGRGWSTSYSGRIEHDPNASTCVVIEDDGTRNTYTKSGGVWTPPTSVYDTLARFESEPDSEIYYWRLTRTSQSQRIFNEDGLLIEVRDSSGNAVTIVRDAGNDDRITAVRSAADGLSLPDDPNEIIDHELTFTYGDPNNPERLTMITDVIDREWKFTYNPGNDRMVKLRYPTDDYVDPSYMEFGYAAVTGRISYIHARRENTDDNDIFWDYQYSGGKLAKVVDPVQASGDPNNIYEQGVGTQIVTDIGTGQTFYNRIITDRRGYDWTWRYDDDGLLVMTTDPLSKHRQFEYDSDRNVVSFTNERGYEWTATYGYIGNLLTLSSPISGQTWTYTWEQVGGAGSNFWRVTQAEDPAGKWVQYEYADPEDPNEPDDATKIVRVIEMPAATGGSSAVTKLKYYDGSVPNYQEQLYRVVDANGVISELLYDKWGYGDGLNEGLVANDPAGLRPVTLSQRNAAIGWVVSGSDRQGVSRICCADGFDIGYDVNGNPVYSCSCSCTNLETSGDYERLGDLPPAEFPRSKQSLLESTNYDTVGNPVNLDRGLPQLITGATMDTYRRHLLEYDDFRRPSSYEVQSAKGIEDGSPLTREFTVDEYDPDGRVLQATGPDGQVSHYTYDEMGRMEAVSRSGMSAAITYDDAGRVMRVDYGNDAAVIRAYDNANRLTSITHKDASNVSQLEITYAWSLDNLVTSRTETTPSGTWLVAFEYDKRDRLTRETRTKTSADPDETEYDIEYAYDQVGNRTARADHVTEQATVYSYDVDFEPNQLDYSTHHNRLLSYELYDTSGVSDVLLRTVTYTYYDTGQASNITVTDEQLDPNGHQWFYDLALHYYTHGPLRLAVWGRWRENQYGPDPSTYEVMGAREFRYDDARARYLSVEIATPENSSSSWFTDGTALWTDYEGVAPYSDLAIDPNALPSSGQNCRYFGLTGRQTLDPNGSVADSDYWHGDLIDSTMLTTDDAGDVAVSPASYTAFGERLTAGGVPGGPAPAGMSRYQYAGGFGYESDLLTLQGEDTSLPPIALQHLGARWYQPDIGRFVQRDPIGIRGGLNVFAYAILTPTVFVDPDGMDIFSGIDDVLDGGINGYPGGGVGAGCGLGAALNFKYRLGIGSVVNRTGVIGAGAWIGWNTGKFIVWLTPIEDGLGWCFKPFFMPVHPGPWSSVPPTEPPDIWPTGPNGEIPGLPKGKYRGGGPGTPTVCY